jgi:hypothetical protein
VVFVGVLLVVGTVTRVVVVLLEVELVVVAPAAPVTGVPDAVIAEVACLIDTAPL